MLQLKPCCNFQFSTRNPWSSHQAAQCAQNIDDIGIAVNHPQQLLATLDSSFCIHTKGRIKSNNCNVTLRRTATQPPRTNHHTHGINPQKLKKRKLLEKVTVTWSNKALKWYNRFLNYYKKYIPRLAERFTPFLQLLKTTDAKNKISTTMEPMNEFRSLNNTLDTYCQLAFIQSLTSKQLVLEAADFAILIAHQKCTSTRKTYAPVSFASKTFVTSEMKMSVNAKKVLAI